MDIVPKCSWSMAYQEWTSIIFIKTDTYYILHFIKENSCSHKSSYEGYL